MPYLVQKDRDGSTIEFWNLHDSPMTVGRGEKCNAKTDDERLSREHFVITEAAGKFTLKDLGSKNGTLVNGQRVTDPVVLKPNDQIQAGQSLFTMMEGLTTMSVKLDQDLKDLDRVAHPPDNPPAA